MPPSAPAKKAAAKKAVTKAPVKKAAAQKPLPKHNPRNAILAAALSHVPFDGWTHEVLQKAGREVGVNAAELMMLYPAGPTDLLWQFAEMGEAEMLAHLNTHKLITMKMRDRIRTGVLCWLAAMAPYKEAVQRALRSSLMPSHALLSVKSIARLASSIWYEAGDQSTDFNYYTKRGLLMAVFGATVIYWLNDQSDDYTKTREFLNQQLDRVLKLGQGIGKVKDLFGQAKGLSGLASHLSGLGETVKTATKRSAQRRA